jgi:transcriptional regulator with XRE-family HTH domain
LPVVDAGKLLRETRLERHLDQSELARRAGTTQTHVSRIERGAVSPSLRTLRRLMLAMGVDLRLSVEPLPVGNQSLRDLRSDLRELTAEERVDQAIELSEFLTDVAGTAAEAKPAIT